MGQARRLGVAWLLVLLGVGCSEAATAESAPRRDAAAVTAETAPSAEQQRWLVDLARQTVAWWVRERTAPELPREQLQGALAAPLGCFVTLQLHPDRLRGCIGMFEPDTPLAENVITRAVAAASQDTRFEPVRPEELPQLHVEVSVLTAPRPLPYADPEELLRTLIPGTLGVILRTRQGSSTYLPQVWEQLPDKAQFLSRLCAKHGALPTCWRDGPQRTQVELYEALVFGEDDHGRVVVGRGGATVGPGGAVYSSPPPPSALRGEPAPFRRGQALAPGTRLAPGTILARGADLQG